MISHSPPIFSHSPPVSFFADYMNNHRQHLPFNDEPNRHLYCRPQVITLASKAIVNNASASAVQHQEMMHRGGRSSCFMTSVPEIPVPPKSCLSRRLTPHSNNNVTEQQTTTRLFNNSYSTKSLFCRNEDQSRSRKRVIFADDEGLSLTEVRIMSEPSNVPPYWSMKFLEQITQGLVSPHPADQWTVDFKQPASDYLSFRQAIERDYVSLENVIVKDDESLIVGTVKVKNIHFEKEVIVRVTWDDWKCQQDIFCTYSRAYGPATSAHVIFDTFSFKITLPPSSKRLEFCICYRTNDSEYWDNNEGKNYTISKRSPFYYPALASNDKNLSRNSDQNHVAISVLTDALSKTNDQLTNTNSNHSSERPSPYW